MQRSTVNSPHTNTVLCRPWARSATWLLTACVGAILLCDVALLSMPDSWAFAVINAKTYLLHTQHLDFGLPRPWVLQTLLWGTVAFVVEVACAHVGWRTRGVDSRATRNRHVRAVIGLGCFLGLWFPIARAEWDIFGYWASYYLCIPS